MTPRSRLVVLCTLLSFGVAACGGSSDGLASSADGSATTAADPSTTAVDTTATTGGEATDANPTTAATPGDAADDGSCLEGDWVVGEEELAGYYVALGEAAGVPMTATGTANFHFADQRFAYSAVFDLEMDLSGQKATASTDGSVEGSYTTSSGVITTQIETNTMDIIVNVGGIEMNASDLGGDALTAVPINESAYSCDGPTIYFQTGGDPYPVVLTRA